MDAPSPPFSSTRMSSPTTGYYERNELRRQGPYKPRSVSTTPFCLCDAKHVAIDCFSPMSGAVSPLSGV